MQDIMVQIWDIPDNLGWVATLGIGCTSVDICVSADLELVDTFCYLGDMLSVDGDADAAVENRI